MDRTRKLAASPVRPAHATWTQIKDLLAESLERSPNVPDDSVRPALSTLDGLACSLIASGHLAGEPLVIVAGELRLSLYAVRGDAAFDLEENLNPVPGAAAAPSNWRMYVPSPSHLRAMADAACADNDHLTSGKPPAAKESGSSAHSNPTYTIDPAALGQI